MSPSGPGGTRRRRSSPTIAMSIPSTWSTSRSTASNRAQAHRPPPHRGAVLPRLRRRRHQCRPRRAKRCRRPSQLLDSLAATTKNPTRVLDDGERPQGIGTVFKARSRTGDHAATGSARGSHSFGHAGSLVYQRSPLGDNFATYSQHTCCGTVEALSCVTAASVTSAPSLLPTEGEPPTLHAEPLTVCVYLRGLS